MCREQKTRVKVAWQAVGIGTVILLLGQMIVGMMTGYVEGESAAFLGYLVEHYPEQEAEIMLAFKNATEAYSEKGKGLLEAYGYTQDRWGGGLQGIIWGSALTFSAIGIGILGWSRWVVKKRYTQKIDTLTQYLERVNKGQASIIPNHIKADETAFLEDELYKTVTTLRTTREQAVEDKQILKDNLADVAHQLKTPLTAMKMMSEMLREVSEEDAQIYIQQLENQLEHTAGLVSALLTLSKLEVDAVTLERNHIPLYILILRAVEVVEPLSLKKNQQLIINPSEPTDEVMGVEFVGDMYWSIEGLVNVIKNCIEHTPEEGWVKIDLIDNPLYTSLVVEDSGKGFSKEDLPYLFKRFYKGKNASKESIGIGLALSKMIFEKQGGLIAAENSRAGGAKFEIKFYKNL